MFEWVDPIDLRLWYFCFLGGPEDDEDDEPYDDEEESDEPYDEEAFLLGCWSHFLLSFLLSSVVLLNNYNVV